MWAWARSGLEIARHLVVDAKQEVGLVIVGQQRGLPTPGVVFPIRGACLSGDPHGGCQEERQGEGRCGLEHLRGCSTCPAGRSGSGRAIAPSVLTQLAVRDLAVMRDASLAPSAGLNVLSGETGAGKSLLVQALSLILGGRAATDAVRAGADRAVVEAVFSLREAPVARQAVVEAGYLEAESDDHELLLRRVVARAGRGGVWINGSPATVAVLRRVAAGLVDLTGQHESVSLLKEDARLAALDSQADAIQLREAMAAAWVERVQAQQALDQLREAAKEGAGRLDWLRFQLAELENVSPKAGEFEALRGDVERLRHAERLVGGSRRASSALYSSDGAARERTDEAKFEVEALAEIDATLSPIAQDLQTASALLEGAAFALRRYADGIDASPGQLAETENRLQSIEKALRTHGCVDDAELAARLPELRNEIDDLDDSDNRLVGLQSAHAEADRVARRAAAALTRARRIAARELSEAVQDAIRGLGMPKAVFRVELTDTDLGPTGADSVQFVLGPNVGETPLPLQRIASGGELARTLLALKGVLADGDAVPVQVFDEVDSGVGGEAAEAVGRRLKELGGSRQVLVITHEPQVAAYADSHFRMTKLEAEGRTETAVVRLSAAEREEELARMLGGADVSGRAKELAQEMLRLAAAG